MTDIKSGVKKFRKIQARSSGGERYLDTVEVVGSNPIVPTIKNRGVTVNVVILNKNPHLWMDTSSLRSPPIYFANNFFLLSQRTCIKRMKSKKRTKFLGIIFLILWIGPCSIGTINLLIESDNYDRGLSYLIGSAETSKLTNRLIGIGIIAFFPFIFFASLYYEQKKRGEFLFKRQSRKKDNQKEEASRKKYQKEWEKPKKERRKIFERNKMMLESGPHKKLVERFVATNRSAWPNTDKLKQLLQSKGFDFKYTELDSIIDEERKRQEYEKFKRTFIDDDLNDLRDYIVIFLDSYGKHYGEQIDFFIRLLKEQKIDFNKDEIENHIQNIIKEIELEKYEKQLFHL